MTDQPDLLTQFSNALAARAEAAKNAVVAIRLAHDRHMTGMVWRSGIVVASEQSLPRNDDFELVAAGGSVLTLPHHPATSESAAKANWRSGPRSPRRFSSARR